MSVEEGYVMAYEDTGSEAILKVTLLEKNGPTCIIKINATGETETISENEFFHLDPAAEQGINDLSDLKYFNEASILINLQKRFSQNLIYTYLSNSLIILNPYQKVDGLVSKKKVDLYKNSDLKDLPPHIFAVTRTAYEEMYQKKSNQVILISGESGAGKTESTKHVINFLTSLKNDSSNVIEKKIIGCSPILEAFGNAKTIRNDNSSRFGKYIKLYYDSDRTTIKSASIETFLLEKSRVVKHESGERNFHVFYLMLKSCPLELLKNLGLCRGEKINFDEFYYVKGDIDAKSINDKQFYEELIEAFNVNNFTSKEIKRIWKILAAILSLGNIKFDDSDFNENNACKISEDSEFYLQNASKLLKVADVAIANSILYFTRVIGNKEIKSPLEKSNCESLRDTMAKYLYDRLFSWIIKKLNSELQGREGIFVGILDIYGFEIFPNNGFEQFCINYANEKLHQLSNDYIFKAEQEEMKKEGLEDHLQSIEYVDNSDIIDLLEGNPFGIFKLIDESCSLKSDDKNLLLSIQKKHKSSEKIVFPKIINDYFTVKHTASDVNYSVFGFVTKNIDEIRPEIEQCLFNSANAQVKSIMTVEAKTGKYLGEKFRKEINTLMQEIRSCNCYFIRCLKPNEFKSAWTFVPRLVLNQIQYLGLLDSIMIRKSGYPIRMSFHEFLSRYACLASILLVNPDNSAIKSQSIQVFEILQQHCLPNSVLRGKSKIFFKVNAEETAESLRKETLHTQSTAAKKIQGWFKVTKMYWNFRKILYNIPKIQAAWRGKQQRESYKVSRGRIIKIQKWYKNLLYKDQIAIRDFGLQIFYQYLKIKIEDAFLEKCFKLAITAQRIWRGHRTRRLLKGKKLITKVFNTAVYRPSFEKLLYQSKLDASILIQKSFRGYLSRKNITPSITKMLQKNKLIRMTVKLQKWFRGEIVRKKISKIRTAARRIQSFFKAKKTRSWYLKLLASVLKIQSVFRSFYIRSNKVRSRLDAFTTKEMALLNNLTVLEHAELFSSVVSSPEFPVQEALKTLSVIAESSASLTSTQLISTGSLSLQSRSVSPFHLEKIYFFTRPLELELITDDSVIYDPLWSKQFESLNLEVISKEEQIMDIALGYCHSLALTNRGKLFAWGWNDKYQCGSAGSRPRLVEGLKEHKIIQVSCGDDHSLALNSSGQVFGFGDNTKGQLGQATYNEVKGVVAVDIPPCKQVVAVGNQNMAVSQNGELYLWPFETIHGEKRSYPMKMLYDSAVSEVSVGYNFAMILATSGLVYSLGSNNKSGQLGHGDFVPRSAPTLVLALKKLGEKISNIECGYRHVAAKSTLGRLYTWGYGIDGQLGHGSFVNEALPKNVSLKNERLKPIQITCGYKHTAVMLENKKILWTGTNTMIKSNVFEETCVAARLPEFFKNTSDFSVVRINSVWSRSINMVNVTFVDLRYLKNNSIKIQNAIASIAAKWTYKSIDPPIIDSISGYYPTSICKKNNIKPNTSKLNKSFRHPIEEMNEKVSEILNKPKEKWTQEDKFTMEHISKLNH